MTRAATELERTRHVLADLQHRHEARGRALDATGLTTFTDRRAWLDTHPITEWLPAPRRIGVPDITDHDLIAVDARGSHCTCGLTVRNWLEHLADIALDTMQAGPSRFEKKRREKHAFTARQLQIANTALANTERKTA